MASQERRAAFRSQCLLKLGEEHIDGIEVWVDLLVRQRTQTINAMRGHLAEFAIVAAKAPLHVAKLVAATEDDRFGIPEMARPILRVAGTRVKSRSRQRCSSQLNTSKNRSRMTPCRDSILSVDHGNGGVDVLAAELFRYR